MTSNASTVSTSQHDRRGEDVAAPLVVGDGEGLVVGGRPAEVDLQPGGAAAAGLAVGVEDLLQRLLRLVDGDQAVGPRGVAGGGLRGDGGTDEVGDGRRAASTAARG